MSGLSGTCSTRDAGGDGILWLKAFAVCWLGEESCLQCYSLSRCLMQEAELQAVCGLIYVQMWLSAVENERLISEAFEVSCFSYASISSPAVDEMWKKIDHHPFDLLTVLIML